MPLDNMTLQRLRGNDTSLSLLELMKNGIDDEEVKVLAAVLEKNTTLTELNLGINQIGAEGAKALATALEKNKTLIELSLSHNQIGCEGTKALAAVLKKNTTLTSLCLNSNEIGVKGTRALAAALEHNSSLTRLGLWSNQIRAEGAKAMAAALVHNVSLTEMDLGSNQIGDAVKNQLERLMKYNQLLLKELQVTALKQLKAARVLLRTLPADNNTVSLANLPLEIREHIVKVIDEKALMTDEQQRLILNYTEGRIAPAADKLSFFRVTKCDRIRKQLKQDGVEAASHSLASMD